jgi:hypothetical protein
MWTQIYAWPDEFCDISRDAKGNLIFDGDQCSGAKDLNQTWIEKCHFRSFVIQIA